jgi:serine/threonine protein kinase
LNEAWHRIEEVFVAALEHNPATRESYVEKECGADVSLRAEVQSLLASHEQARDFIEAPAVAFVHELLPVELTSDEAAADAASSVDGQRVGNYEIERELGRGGMGTVYLAHRADDQYKKLVAIKIVRRGMDTQDIVRRFRNERQILASLEHTNIARLLDGGTTGDGVPYIVMEYVEGVAITNYCDEHRLKTSERLQLFRTVGAAVQYAHQNLVVHRDLKPSNILVTADGTPKLLDFGIAKLLSPELSADTAEHTLTELRILTPDYASPEQVRGETLTTTSDIYSLGVVLYELLTGHRPYHLINHAPHELARVIGEQEPTKPSTAAASIEILTRGDGAKPQTAITPESVSLARDTQPDKLRRRLSGDLDNIVLKAMRKEPARRYDSAAQLAADIERHLDGLPVLARKDTFNYRAGKFVRRHKAGVAAAALVAASLMTGVIVATWQAHVAARERDRARVEATKAERINIFLQDMLAFSNPSWSSPNTQKGREVTINEMLDEVAPRLESELSGQPEVKAALERTIGDSYTSQTRNELAERYLKAALDTDLKLYGEDNLETARTLHSLAQLRSASGNGGEAESLLERALAVYRKHYRAGRGEARGYASTLSTYAALAQGRGNENFAESLVNEGLALSPQLTGNERAIVAMLQSVMGQVRRDQSRYDEAVSLQRAAITEFKTLQGRKRWEMGDTLMSLGGVLGNQRHLDEALAVMQEGGEIYRQTVGENSPSYVECLSQQAWILFLKEDYAAAGGKVDGGLEILQRIYPHGHPLYADLYKSRGRILTKMGKAQQGEVFIRQALDMYRRNVTKNNPALIHGIFVLSDCLTAQGRFTEAEELLQGVYRDAIGKPDLKWQETYAASELAKFYGARGKPEQAAQYRAML